jgi:hypothetical protein
VGETTAANQEDENAMAKGKKRASASTVRAEIKRLRAEWGWSPSDIINLLRGGGSSGKGSAYERDMCRRLSRWWTDGARDDIFWRSSGSGARAKVRGRGGRDTAGQHGDVAATDPIGAPLIDIFTIELKRGYSEYTFQDLVDREIKAGVQEWERFIMQTIESHDQAGSLAWLMITRRDRRRALAWMPTFMLKELRGVGAFPGGYPAPLVRMKVTVRDSGKRLHRVDVCGMSLDDWLAEIKPEHVRRLV